jgi:hypothetical protein
MVEKRSGMLYKLDEFGRPDQLGMRMATPLGRYCSLHRQLSRNGRGGRKELGEEQTPPPRTSMHCDWLFLSTEDLPPDSRIAATSGHGVDSINAKAPHTAVAMAKKGK